MRVSMEYFMKKRNIGWVAFQNLEYDRYVTWCHVRKIIPVGEQEFLANKTPKQEVQTVEVKELPPNPRHSDPKLLNRRKKAELVELATVYGIELDGSETKKKLVSLIIDVNNG